MARNVAVINKQKVKGSETSLSVVEIAKTQ